MRFELTRVCHSSGLAAKYSSALLTALRDEAEQVRQAAAWALGQLRDPTAVSSLLATAIDSRAYVRTSIAWALGRLGATDTVPLLVAMAQPQVEYIAALIHLDATRALQVLERFQPQLYDQSWSARLRGQALWEQGKIAEVMTALNRAVAQECDIENLLALAHFHVEHDELSVAEQLVNQVLEQDAAHPLGLLSHGIILWRQTAIEKALACLDQAYDAGLRWADVDEATDDLKFEHFWREKALCTLGEMLTYAMNQS